MRLEDVNITDEVLNPRGQKKTEDDYDDSDYDYSDEDE
jgi:hypothetical protein